MTKAAQKPQQEQNNIKKSEIKELTVAEIRGAIPKELFIRDELRFLVSVGFSLSLTLFTGYLAYHFIPLTLAYLPVWIIYAIVNGTFATGLWVLGHECGHEAFSDSKLLNDILGYVIHTPLLVPYFSWQHSHHVHHSKCNHMEIGETHVPLKEGSKGAQTYKKLKAQIGEDAFAFLNMNLIAFIGWPAYLLFGVTGGPERGFTSHFIVPNKLFPQEKLFKVGLSNLGLLFTVYLLYLWAQATSFALVAALYVGPYLIVNCYLTIYTFLHHTDETVPHYDHRTWTWVRGALGTIDRNYPAYINALHFDIGSTHVVHHLFHELPHYNAVVANVYLKEKLGPLYNYDSRPIWKAFFDCAKLVDVKDNGEGIWRF